MDYMTVESEHLIAMTLINKARSILLDMYTRDPGRELQTVSAGRRESVQVSCSALQVQGGHPVLFVPAYIGGCHTKKKPICAQTCAPH